MIWVIVLLVCILAILHTYIFYPVIVKILAARKSNETQDFSPEDPPPFVSVIMSVYNEEDVIIEKLRSIGKTNYPEEWYEILVGSDGSDDQTNDILKLYSEDTESIRFFPFNERQGKGKVINFLRNHAKGEILILTDAKVFFTPDLIPNLVKHFQDKNTGLVGANIINRRLDKSGISYQEWTFMSREIKLKHYEGKVWGAMIGAYGACYAIRNELYSPVPEGYAVDDFYITMKVLEREFRCILDLNATGYENVPNSLNEEFRRKIRISAGNFQNMKTFSYLLWPPFTGLAFGFFSHKILRWLTPFLLILIFISNGFIYRDHIVLTVSMAGQIVLLVLPFIDLLLRKIGIHIVLLRFITHFYSMNLALLTGFIKFLTGSKTNVWQPTSRVEG